MANKYMFRCDVKRLPFCCGVYEVGNFHTRSASEETMAVYPNDYRGFVYDSKEDSWTGALTKILGDFPTHVIQFWFYKPSDSDGEFENSDWTEKGFREMVMKHPNCTPIAEYVNKNSGNMISGFMIDNGTSQNRDKVLNDY